MYFLNPNSSLWQGFRAELIKAHQLLQNASETTVGSSGSLWQTKTTSGWRQENMLFTLQLFLTINALKEAPSSKLLPLYYVNVW